MDEYPEYDFYNSGEACDGKDRRGEERRGGIGKENQKKDKVGQEVWLIKREENEEKPYNKIGKKKKRLKWKVKLWMLAHSQETESRWLT